MIWSPAHSHKPPTIANCQLIQATASLITVNPFLRSQWNSEGISEAFQHLIVKTPSLFPPTNNRLANLIEMLFLSLWFLVKSLSLLGAHVALDKFCLCRCHPQSSSLTLLWDINTVTKMMSSAPWGPVTGPGNPHLPDFFFPSSFPQ